MFQPSSFTSFSTLAEVGDVGRPDNSSIAQDVIIYEKETEITPTVLTYNSSLDPTSALRKSEKRAKNRKSQANHRARNKARIAHIEAQLQDYRDLCRRLEAENQTLKRQISFTTLAQIEAASKIQQDAMNSAIHPGYHDASTWSPLQFLFDPTPGSYPSLWKCDFSFDDTPPKRGDPQQRA